MVKLQTKFILHKQFKFQENNASNDLPPLLQKSSVLRAASALGIVGEQPRSIAFTPHKAWVPQATTVREAKLSACILYGSMISSELFFLEVSPVFYLIFFLS